MSNVIFQKSYQLTKEYQSVKQRAISILGKYLTYPNLIRFNDSDRSVTFRTERLIPKCFTNRPHIMLLFSNPHPHSVHQGMFLSPNTRGRESMFWCIMSDAGWLPTQKENRDPKNLADKCLGLDYQGPFDFVFYCYYAFPTNYPDDIQRIFGEDFFHNVIEPEAKREFKKTVIEAGVDAIVTFNKEIFNLVSIDFIDTYIKWLIEGNLICSKARDINKNIPIYLTFPTGWHYHKQFKQLRVDSLDAIRTAICNECG